MLWFGLRVVPLEGESEANNDVGEGEKNETEKNLANKEKEGLKGGLDLGFFAFGHGVMWFEFPRDGCAAPVGGVRQWQARSSRGRF